MPHYKDGTPAEIGDLVKGVPYNTHGKAVVGTLVQITEGTESCNCIVAFVDPFTVEAGSQLYQLQPHVKSIVRRKGGRILANQTDAVQELLILNASYDYGALKDFEKLA